MIIQEQLEKITRKYISNVPIKGKLDCTQCLYINEGAIIKLTSAILSAMRIDEDGLCYLLGRRSHLGIPLWEHGVEAIISAIASHAQEIIKFEEE